MKQFNNVPNKTYKTEDGIKHHSRSCAVVNHIWCQLEKSETEVEHYVLVGLRGKAGDMPGKLNLPCGYMDWNETIEEAAKREVYEETGLDIDEQKDIILNNLIQPWFVGSDPTDNRQNISMHVAFIFKIEGSEDKLPKLSLEHMEKDESDGVYWMPISEIADTESDKWAFGHKERILQFTTLLTNQ